MVKVPTKTLERQLVAQGHSHVVGVDEVGMACLAGPVVVCALAVEPSFYDRAHRDLAGLRDSKMLQPHQREYYARLLIVQPGLQWKIGSCDPTVIDELNIYQASRLAMRTAIAELALIGNLIVLVDGNKKIPGLTLPQRPVVKGDQKIWAIAAASIIAKVYRDRLMTEYAKEFPGYGFEVHKGYPTTLHRTRLQELGLCPIHRRSFSAKAVILTK